MADAYGSGPYECKFMQVQVLLPAPKQSGYSSFGWPDCYKIFCRKKIKFLLRFFIVFSLSMRTGELRAYIKRKSMQSLSLHQHSLLIENSNIPYLSPSGSAEILPATRKVMIVLTPLQRRDAYCRVRCAKCTVQAVRDARSITLYRDRLSRQSSGYVLWSCRGSRAIPLGCPGFMA